MTDYRVMNKRAAEWAAKELLATLQESKFLRRLRKSEAIRKIKAQPFFGNALPKPVGETVTFRRLAPYKVVNDKT